MRKFPHRVSLTNVFKSLEWYHSFETFKMVSSSEKWLCNLIGELEKNVGEEILKGVLEDCGRKCQSQKFVEKARAIYEKSKNLDTFLAEFEQTYKHLHREKDGDYIIYPKCYCTRVNKIPSGQMPPIYCNCSRGWAKALFEGALGRPVEVKLEKSIVSGDNECRFKIEF
jgi:predicted ArsR family transcriptional regulator